jgi:cyanophycinase-like exopeptidase
MTNKTGEKGSHANLIKRRWSGGGAVIGSSAGFIGKIQSDFIYERRDADAGLKVRKEKT